VKVGAALKDAAELLLRQVHPTFVRDGRPSSQVFRPTPKDEGLLSVNRGASTSPLSAYATFIARPHCKSCGVVAVTVGDCENQQLPAHDAPMVAQDDGHDDPSHAVINFNGLSKSAVEKKASVLIRIAMEHGFRHGPVVVAPSAPITLRVPVAPPARAAEEPALPDPDSSKG
jgi:hypothetical protein